MAWDMPGPRLAFGAADAAGMNSGVSSLPPVSVHATPLFWIYHSVMDMGRFALRVADGAGIFCRRLAGQALTGGVDAAGVVYRWLSSVNRSRAVRGEISISRALLHVSRRMADGWRAVFRTMAELGPVAAAEFAAQSAAAAAGRAWARHRHALNYLAPAAGLAVLGLTVYFWSHMTFAVAVTYNGRQLGYVSSEQAFRTAANEMEARVSDVSGASFSLTSTPVYQVRLAKSSQLLSQDAIMDNLVSASGGEVTNGYGLYVDNKLVGANGDSQALQQMLDNIVAPYRADAGNRDVSIAQDVSIKSGIFPTSVIKDTGNLQAELTGGTSAEESYTVKKGDSMPMIANMFNVPLSSLTAMNTSAAGGGLRQGEVVRIATAKPTISVKFTRNEVTSQPIPYAVQQIGSNDLPQGTTKVAVQGQPGTLQTVNAVTYEGNRVVSSQVVSVTMSKAPVTEQQIIGTKAAARGSAAARGTQSVSGSSGSSSGYSGGGYYTGSGSASSGNVVALAERYLGSRYVSGGSSPSGFDCSGFTSYIYGQMGVSLEHSAAGQYSSGNKVSSSGLQSGDLVFFRTGGSGSGVSHVGIYIGGGQFINAENHRVGVVIASLSGYWANTYAGAVRP